jgi:hypothetical protein
VQGAIRSIGWLYNDKTQVGLGILWPRPARSFAVEGGLSASVKPIESKLQEKLFVTALVFQAEEGRWCPLSSSD